MENLLFHYSYGAIFLIVAIESMGVPVPGETILITAAVYAGTTHKLNIDLVILSASLGAIIGDNFGFWIGRAIGFPIIHRFGKYLRLNEKRLKVGQYLFYKYGGRVVFWGRFIGVLRIWAAFLAGVNHMNWQRFLAFNIAGGVLWATFFGTISYILGQEIISAEGSFRIIMLGAAAIVILGIYLYLRHHERQLSKEAEKVFP